MTDVWLKCSACRKDIGFQTVHWVCSVSTCNRSRTRLVFCSVACWDSHVATLRHREAWAVEARSPTRAQWQAEQAAAPAEPSAPRPAAPAAPVVRQPVSAPPAVVRPAAPSAAPSSLGSSATSFGAAPTSSSAVVSSPTADDPRRRVVSVASASPEPAGPELSDTFERDILIVVSKMKKYIRDRSGMNCSDAVAEVLSDHVRLLCDQCIRTASADGRKTVLDRDVPKPR